MVFLLSVVAGPSRLTVATDALEGAETETLFLPGGGLMAHACLTKLHRLPEG